MGQCPLALSVEDVLHLLIESGRFTIIGGNQSNLRMWAREKERRQKLYEHGWQVFLLLLVCKWNTKSNYLGFHVMIDSTLKYQLYFQERWVFEDISKSKGNMVSLKEIRLFHKTVKTTVCFYTRTQGHITVSDNFRFSVDNSKLDPIHLKCNLD